MTYCANCIKCESHTVITASAFYCSARRMYVNPIGCCLWYAPKIGYSPKMDLKDHYCDRNKCLQMEYNGKGCAECEVTE